MTRVGRTRLAVGCALTAVMLLTACAREDVREDHRMGTTTTDSSAAKAVWRGLSTRVAETQRIVGGDWVFSDTNARECGSGGAQWGITRLGPGVAKSEREALFDRVEAVWKANGWDAVRTPLPGDTPGLQLRYPAAGSLDGGFFVEFAATVHGATIDAQTGCAAGDVDELAREQFAYHNTPGRTPSPTPMP